MIQLCIYPCPSGCLRLCSCGLRCSERGRTRHLKKTEKQTPANTVFTVFCPGGSAVWPQCWLCAVCAVGHVGCCGGGGYPVGVSISSSTRCPLVNNLPLRLPEALQLRAEVLGAREDAARDAPPHVELAAGTSTDVYCFEPLGACYYSFILYGPLR